MKYPQYPHQRKLETLKKMGVKDSDIPKGILDLHLKFISDANNTKHINGKQNASLLRASNDLEKIIDDWYDDYDHEEDVPEHTCGCKNDKILAKIYNEGGNCTSKKCLKEKGYSFGIGGSPVKNTKNFELKPDKKGYKIVKKS